MRAVQLTAFVIRSRLFNSSEIEEPAAPGPGQVLIGVEFSPVDLSDLLLVRGVYPLRPSLLVASLATRAWAWFLAIGPGVETVTVGDRVLTPLYGFAWAERIVVSAARPVRTCPPTSIRSRACHADHQSADRRAVAEEFVDLASGDWVAQNAANSGVGRSVIAFAKRVASRRSIWSADRN